ncbi:ribosomal protein L4/L1e [Nitrosococcus halophilus Nc 4]|uniref:Large ribosomal subunit protein uL4 n=2 Tax=Nitrosococcus halophilus TaxID=133539 RepID=D5BVP5_NITHN|nr:ribosomal protein L4/L1e [Nitrosococcus halophilus Nc 4]
MELAVQSLAENAETGMIQVSDVVFAQYFNEPLIHQVVTAYLAKDRAGTRAQKTRSEVRGGGAKPFRQKGTGRARAGTIRSPLWRGGGKVFAAKPRDYSQKVNKKMYRAAMRSILSELARQDRLRVVNEIVFPEPKTKELVKLLSAYDWRSVLVVVAEDNPNLELSARNIPAVAVGNASNISPVDLIRFDGVLATDAAIRRFEESLA